MRIGIVKRDIGDALKGEEIFIFDENMKGGDVDVDCLIIERNRRVRIPVADIKFED